MKIQRFVFILIALIFAMSSFAQNFSFSHLTMSEGLPANGVRCVLQDKYGFMWFGTDNGLCRYDGQKIINITVDEKYQNCYISSLLIAGDNLFIGTDHGVYVLNLFYDKISKLYIPDIEALSNVTVINFGLSSDGLVWISTDKAGLFSYDGSKNEVVRYSLDGNLEILSVFADKKGGVYATARRCPGHIFFKSSSSDGFKSVKLKNIPSTVSARTIFEDSDGGIWLGTWENGLFKIDSTGNATKAPIPEKTLNHIHAVTEYRSGLLLIGSDNGLCSYDVKNGNFKIFYPDNSVNTSISSYFVYSLFVAPNLGLWAGTFYGGINYSPAENRWFENFTSHSYKNSLSGNVVGRFCEDNDGNLWIATDDGGLNRYNLKTKIFSNYMKEKNIHALSCDASGIWVGSYSEQIFCFNPKTLKTKHYGSESGFYGTSCYAFSFIDKTKTLYAASWDSLYVFDSESDMFRSLCGLKGIAYDIESDSKGGLWITSNGGLSCYDTEKNQLNYYKSEVETGDVNALVIVDGDFAYVGAQNGLFKFYFADKKFEKEDLKVNLSEINSLEYFNGRLFIGTQNGLAVYDGNRLGVFNKQNGLVSGQFIANSSLKASDGKVYMGTTNGFTAFLPQEIPLDRPLPKVRITSIDIVGKKQQTDTAYFLRKQVVLSEDSASLALDFTSLNYYGKDNNYKFMVEGIDTAWLFIDKGSITMNYFPVGNFVFKIRPVLPSGIEGDETRLNIIVKSNPIKARVILIPVLVLIVFLGGGVWFYVKTKKKEEVQVQDNEKEKTSEDTPEVPLKQPKENPDGKFLEELNTLIIENVQNEELNAVFLCEKLGYSRSSMFAKIKQLTGKTPNELIQSIRLKKAAELLSTNLYKVNEVAYMTGFNNPSYFAKLFQKQYGVKPKEIGGNR
ncbi:MAG: helix-turn-helix domain-containing protein [Bacteroidales bacterium]|nr:helix-turn-helix domain-containing protein [Bacteroidales bacterium]